MISKSRSFPMPDHNDVFTDINDCIKEDILALSEEIKENNCNCDEALTLYGEVLYNTYGQKWMTFLMEHPRIGIEIRESCAESLDMEFKDENGSRQDVTAWVDCKTNKTCAEIFKAVQARLGIR
jgi:hypothetical protein